jgi:hypothetical protein
MERPRGSRFEHEGKTIKVVYDEFHDCSTCCFDPEKCDDIKMVRGTCINRVYPVVFQECQKPIGNK